jgi:hypothetical protein
MKWFDSLFSDKKIPTSLSKGDDIASNTTKTSYKDIKKRHPIISLTRDIFDTKKSYTPFSLRKSIEQLCESCPRYAASMTRRHWILIFVLLILAYSVYAVGFILRTEDNISALRDNPGGLMTHEGLMHLRAMRGDYQILAPIIQNPFFPLEPLATYGKALNIAYGIVMDMDILSDIESELMLWKEHASSTSIFPILDTFFTWIGSIDDDVQSVLRMLGSKGDVDVTGAEVFWQNIQKYRETWYTLLGQK